MKILFLTIFAIFINATDTFAWPRHHRYGSTVVIGAPIVIAPSPYYYSPYYPYPYPSYPYPHSTIVVQNSAPPPQVVIVHDSPAAQSKESLNTIMCNFIKRFDVLSGKLGTADATAAFYTAFKSDFEKYRTLQATEYKTPIFGQSCPITSDSAIYESDNLSDDAGKNASVCKTIAALQTQATQISAYAIAKEKLNACASTLEFNRKSRFVGLGC
jgi:hypothetical protein